MANKPGISEKELVQGCVDNERTAQEALYKQYFRPMMYMCLRYTSDRDEAMSIVNDGFLRVFKKIHTFSFKGSLEGWIRRLVFHSLADYFRKKNRKHMHFLVFEDWDTEVRNEALPELYFEDLLKMVDRLPPATKQVFHLYAIEGYNHAEIAEQTGISEGTSKWHLSSARQKLKEMLRQRSKQQLYAG